MTWSSVRAQSFEKMLALWPGTLNFKGVDYDCIAPQQEEIKQMQQSAFMMRRPGSFSMRQSDFESSGITDRSTVTYSGLQFEIYSILIDSSDTIVDLTAKLKQ